jgi:hypothetical protein
MILTARSTFWCKWPNTLSCGLAGVAIFPRLLQMPGTAITRKCLAATSSGCLLCW